MSMQQPHNPGPPFGQPGGMPGGIPGGMPGGFPGSQAQPAADGKKSKKGKPEKAKKPATARQQARRNGLVATLFAIIAVAAALVMLRQPPPATGYVVVAAKLLPAGSTVTEDGLTTVKMPVSFIEQGAAWGATSEAAMELVLGKREARKADGSGTESWQVVGRRPKYPVLQGQQIHPNPVFTDAIDLARPLGKDERLITVTVEIDRGLLGKLQAGDRIDLLTYVKDDEADIGNVVVLPGDETATAPDAEQPTTPVIDGSGEIVVGPEIPAPSATERVRILAEQAEIVAVASDDSVSGADSGPFAPTMYVLRVKAADIPSLIAAYDGAYQLHAVYRGAVDTTTGKAVATTTTTTTTTPKAGG